MSDAKQGLQRNISLFAAICIMTGCVVGASVFIVPGELSASTGPTAWLSYLIGAILISFSCFMFAQVGAILPVAGANYVLCTGAVSGTWGFLYVWSFLLSNSFLFPIMSKTAATYLSVIIPGLSEYIEVISVLVILFTCALNLLGNNLSAKVQNGCVILLVTVVIIFSAGGISHADWSHFEPMFPNGLMPVIVGVISTYYAFAGVNCIIELSGEIRNPEKNIPRTVFISFGIVVVMYIGMCVGLVGLMRPEELGVAAPAVTASRIIFPGWFQYFIALAAIAASWTTLNAIVSSMARLIYVLGKSGILPSGMARLNGRNVPRNAIGVLAVMGVLMVMFSATVMQYVNVSSFYLLFVSILVAVASLRIRTGFSAQYEAAEYKLKGIWYYVWPILAIITGIFFMILQFQQDPMMTGVSLVLVPVGILFYLIRKKRLEADGTSLDKRILEHLGS
ncbi:MAG: APC family permease [Lachnospiraceae bacterium]|nr:APC family permease [Lachnospiraceae bacterium]